MNSRFEWKDWRFGLEYDFLYGSRGYLGFIAEAKYTDVEVDLTSPLASEFTKAQTAAAEVQTQVNNLIRTMGRAAAR